MEVIGHWKDAQGKERSGLLGYVPRKLSARIAEEKLQSKLSPTIDTLIFPWRNRSPGIRFSLWVCS
ncbi:MAG: hypothetical protein QMD88_09075 [Coprothermobacterota bacterium]|nr:hypothetical protein [Coprothermobacterota bacterium]